jgi:hypothetical protein
MIEASAVATASSSPLATLADKAVEATDRAEPSLRRR